MLNGTFGDIVIGIEIDPPGINQDDFAISDGCVGKQTIPSHSGMIGYNRNIAAG
jgi:hypothetical protein